MLVIGLTGGIGSGKSTVARFFSELNVPVIDADRIAHQFSSPNTTSFQQIIAYFGSSILNEQGSINRRLLRQLVFDDPSKRKWLEQLLHPLIIEEIKKQLQQVQSTYCIVVIPLLIETGPYPFIDRILVVDTPNEIALKRSHERDKAAIEELKKIINSQISLEERLAKADDIIQNKGTLEKLQAQVKYFHQQYLKIAKIK